MIELLVNSEIDTIIQLVNNHDHAYLDSIIRHGWKGYAEMDNDALEQEYNDRIAE